MVHTRRALSWPQPLFLFELLLTRHIKSGSGRVALSLSGAGAARLSVHGRDFAGLHQRFEIPQVVAHLPARRFTKDGRQPVTEFPGRRDIVHEDVHFGAAIPHGFRKANLADAVDLRARRRSLALWPPSASGDHRSRGLLSGET